VQYYALQGPGTARRIRAHLLKAEFDRHSFFLKRVHRYLHLLITQLSQAAVCHHFHTAEQRLCRFLLLAQDHTKSKEFQFTQEFFSEMLGVSLVCVNVTASSLQKAGWIRYSRGHIVILDRQSLEATACECYELLRKEFDRLFGLLFFTPFFYSYINYFIDSYTYY
jgi:CRP-like cAMP-binding protein